MKKNKILNNLKTIFVAVLFFVGVSYVVSYTSPSSTPAGGLVDEGTPDQAKEGILMLGGLLNTGFSPIVTHGDLYVGLSSQNVEADSRFFGDVYLPNLANGSNNQPICSDVNGQIKLCGQGVIFEPVQDVYYTPTNQVYYSTVTGAVSYKIDPSVSCQTVATSGTSWGTTTLNGTNTNYSVTFSDWGKYTLSMNCSNSKTYSVTINVKGKIIPTSTNSIERFFFSTTRTLELDIVGAGGSGLDVKYSCQSGDDGFPSFSHITNSNSWTGNSSTANLMSVEGGHGPVRWGSGCTGFPNNVLGEGGKIVVNSSNISQSVITRQGWGEPITWNNRTGKGGCPGSVATQYEAQSGCTSKPGSGGRGDHGGGGGAYMSGKHLISSGNYLYLYVGGSVGSGSTASQPGSIVVEFQ